MINFFTVVVNLPRVRMMHQHSKERFVCKNFDRLMNACIILSFGTFALVLFWEQWSACLEVYDSMFFVDFSLQWSAFFAQHAYALWSVVHKKDLLVCIMYMSLCFFCFEHMMHIYYWYFFYLLLSFVCSYRETVVWARKFCFRLVNKCWQVFLL